MTTLQKPPAALPRYADHKLVEQLQEANSTLIYRTWESTALATKKATAGFCSYRGCWQRGSAAHHVAYQDSEGAIVGRELEGVHVFWLCRTHHSKRHKQGAHHPLNWFGGKQPIEARNTTAYYRLLREGYQEKRQWIKDNPDWYRRVRKCGPRRSKVGRPKKRCSSGSKTS